MITINNKYNIGDTLWKIYNNKPTEYIVEGIEFKLINGKSLLYYCVKDLRLIYVDSYREDQLDEIFYPTKEKCILSLFDK